MLILVIICLVGALGLAYWSEKRSVSAPSGPAKVTVTVRDDVGKPVREREL